MYMNSDEMVPARLQLMERGLLGLELWTLLHALATRRLYVWIGVLLFGLFQEVLGWVVGTHFHEQFRVQVLEFLPLKEILVYQLILYHSHVAVQQLGIKSHWACGVVVAFVNHFANAPYDFMGGRKGFGFWRLSSTFPYANFEAGEWHGGVPAVFYGWLVMGFAYGIVLAHITKHRITGFKASLLISSGAALSATFWTPYHILKSLGCAWSTPFLLLDLADKPQAFLKCIRSSPMTDLYIYVVAYFSLLALLPLALRCRSASNSNCSAGIDSLLLVSVAGYHLLLLYMYVTYDHEPHFTVPVLVAWVSCATLVHVLCYGFSFSVQAKANNNKKKPT